MPTVDPSGGVNTRKCAESTVNKMRAMCQLVAGMARGGSIPLASLIPIARIIISIADQNRTAYYQSFYDLSAFTADKKEKVTLQDLPAVAEVNFLEGFVSFLALMSDNSKGQREMLDDSSIQFSSIIKKTIPKRRTTKRLDDTREIGPPAKKSARVNQEVIELSDDEEVDKEKKKDEEEEVVDKKGEEEEEEDEVVDKKGEEEEDEVVDKKKEEEEMDKGEEEMDMGEEEMDKKGEKEIDKGEEEIVPAMPTRKSTRRSVDSGVRFDCVFNGCTNKFGSAKDLVAHAEECANKSNQMLVFVCSCCKTSFSSDKAVKSHMTNARNVKCANATIKIDCEKKPLEVESGKKSIKVDCEKKPLKVESVKKSTEKSGEDRQKRAISSRDSMPGSKPVNNSTGKGDNSKCQPLECPSEGCKYSNKNPDLLYSHCKSIHPDFNTIFKCLNCGETRSSGKAIGNHTSLTCIDSKFELKLVEKTDGDEKAKTVPAIPPTPLTPNDPTVEWDREYSKCPIQSCDFIASAARNLAPHINRNHSESKISYQCTKCVHSNLSIMSMMAHCKNCLDSHPEVVVNGEIIGRKKLEGRLTRRSFAATKETRKRGNAFLIDSSKTGDEKRSEEDGVEMPELEIMVNDDDDAMGEEAKGEVEEKEESMDVAGSSKNRKKGERG